MDLALLKPYVLRLTQVFRVLVNPASRVTVRSVMTSTSAPRRQLVVAPTPNVPTPRVATSAFATKDGLGMERSVLVCLLQVIPSYTVQLMTTVRSLPNTVPVRSTLSASLSIPESSVLALRDTLETVSTVTPSALIPRAPTTALSSTRNMASATSMPSVHRPTLVFLAPARLVTRAMVSLVSILMSAMSLELPPSLALFTLTARTNNPDSAVPVRRVTLEMVISAKVGHLFSHLLIICSC